MNLHHISLNNSKNTAHKQISNMPEKNRSFKITDNASGYLNYTVSS